MSETARPEVPQVLARICRRALSRAPSDRHATARQLADELEAAMAALGLSATPREIGETIARLFADIRIETKRTIEAKLGRASMATGLPAVSDTGETRVLPPTIARRRLRLLAILGASAGVAALVGLVISRVTGEKAAAESVATAARTAAPIAAPAAPVAKPHTNLAATSPDATPSPEEPAAAVKPSRPSGGAARAIMRRSQSAGTASAAPASAPAETPAASAAPAPASDCAHPFFVDSNGIKRFRPECM
jgi:hypothetical protein